MYLDIPLHRCNFCEFVFKTLPVRSKYPAETTNFYRPPEVAVRPKHPKCKKRKTKNEFVFRFSYFTFENEKRKGNSLSVFRSQIWKRKTKKEFVIRFSFANLKTKNDKTVYTRTQSNVSPRMRLEVRNDAFYAVPRQCGCDVLHQPCVLCRCGWGCIDFCK